MLYLLPARNKRVKHNIKFRAMIMMGKMTQLVHDNVVNTLFGRFDQIRVEGYRALERKTSPSFLHVLNGELGLVYSKAIEFRPAAIQALVELQMRFIQIPLI